MRPLSPALLLLALAASASAARAEDGALAVLDARVAFRTGRGDLPEEAMGTVRLRGDLVATAGLQGYEPDPSTIAASLGPATLAGGDEPAARHRVARARNGSWTLATRGAWGGRGTFVLRLFPASGRFDALARGFPASGLLAAGPSGAALTLRIGGETWSGSIDFEVSERGSWSFRLEPAPRTPPPGGGGPGTPPPPFTGNFQTVAQGSASGIRTFRVAVVFDDAAWQALWLQHAGTGPAPAVDFSAEMVIGVWLGDRPTSGYRGEVLSLASAQIIGAPGVGPGVMATLRESEPGYNCVVSQVVTQPFHIVRTARTSGGVMVEMLTLADGCY